MGARLIELRWRGRCASCHGELGAGETAKFDERSREITCLGCATGTTPRATTGLIDWTVPDPTPTKVEADPTEVKRLIADARAALEASSQAS